MGCGGLCRQKRQARNTGRARPYADMPNPATAEAPARLPAAIEAAILAASLALPHLSPTLRAALIELLRCVPASEPGGRFRCSVAHLMARMGRSRNTISRYLGALVAAGLLERWQSTRGARRWGFRCSWMRLSTAALEALGLQRAPQPAHVPNQASPGNRWSRVRRIPKDLTSLAARVGERRVVWLMGECRKAGRRLQEFAAGALSADSPVGFVLHALRGAARAPAPGNTGAAAAGGGAQCVNVGQATPAAAVCAGRDEQRAAAITGGAARARLEQWRALRER